MAVNDRGTFLPELGLGTLLILIQIVPPPDHSLSAAEEC